MQVGTSIREALELMESRGFDQLPVRREDVVVGVFSYRSLVKNLKHVRREDDLLKSWVNDFLEECKFVRSTSEVGDVLTAIEASGAVLVGDEERLLAVATASDVSVFLWNTSRPFILLQDIELSIRFLMQRACPSPDDLAACIAVGVPATVDFQPPRTLDGLTYQQLLDVLMKPDEFSRRFSGTFGKQRQLVRATLEPVRDIRNKVFHFRDDVTLDELQTLVSARGWLQRKVAMS